MPYHAVFSPDVEKALRRMKKRDRALFERVGKKIEEILERPEVYKPLRRPLQGFRRVHVGPFVLVFEVTGDAVRFLVLDHHDKAYGR